MQLGVLFTFSLHQPFTIAKYANTFQYLPGVSDQWDELVEQND